MGKATKVTLVVFFGCMVATVLIVIVWFRVENDISEARRTSELVLANGKAMVTILQSNNEIIKALDEDAPARLQFLTRRFDAIDESLAHLGCHCTEGANAAPTPHP